MFRIGQVGDGTAIAVKVSIDTTSVTECSAGPLMTSGYKPPQEKILTQQQHVVLGARRRVVMVHDLNSKYSDWG